MDFKEKAIRIQKDNITLVARYQPVSLRAEDSIEAYRTLVKDMIANTPPSTCWLSKETTTLMWAEHPNDQGGLEPGDLALRLINKDAIWWTGAESKNYVGSVFPLHQRQGTWMNKSTRTWYELDGFIMRSNQRPGHVVAMQTVKELLYSDHKLVVLKIKTKINGVYQRNCRTTGWETFRQPEKRNEIRRVLADLTSEKGIGKMRLEKISGILVEAARQVCGIQVSWKYLDRRKGRRSSWDAIGDEQVDSGKELRIGHDTEPNNNRDIPEEMVIYSER